MDEENKSSLSNKVAEANKNAKTAKNLAKAATKAAAQDYVGAVVDAAKEVLGNPEFFIKIIAISLIPVLIIVFILVAPFAMLFSTIDDNPEKYIGTETEIGFQLDKVAKKTITEKVKNAYNKCHEAIKDDIIADAEAKKPNYDDFDYTIIDPFDEGIPEEEIIKIYACFSVLMEREHLKTEYEETDTAGTSYFDQEKVVFDNEKLVKILVENRNKLFTWTVEDNSWTEEITITSEKTSTDATTSDTNNTPSDGNESTAEDSLITVDKIAESSPFGDAIGDFVNTQSSESTAAETSTDETATEGTTSTTESTIYIHHGVFVYTIKLIDTVDMARDVFGLVDNSKNVEVEEKLRNNEIQQAKDKEISLLKLMNYEVLDQYVSAGASDFTNTISQYKNDGIKIENVNFSPSGEMQYPLHGYEKRVTSKYGPRIHPVTGQQSFHKGVDFGASQGTKIYSFANGIVIARGYNDSAGNFVTIYHGTIDGYDYATIYMHLVQPATVEIGDQVTAETVIGQVGSTGLSTGPHLHFGVLKGEEGETMSYVEPEQYIN